MTDDERRARAGDFVLGLMDDAERQKAERDMASDPLFSSAVESLAARLHALDADIAPARVSEGLWDRIASAIGAQEKATSSQRNASVKPAVLHRPRPDLNAMRIAAMAASLAVAIWVGYLIGSSTPQQPVVIVVLQTPTNETGAVFEAYADNSVRVVPLENFEVPAGKIMQVWTLYDQSVGPVSLGTLSEAKATTLKGHPFPIPVADQLYEITLEPAPGSPTGKPTGPILVKGFARAPAS
jgi:anti-sigma-K factor RskA